MRAWARTCRSGHARLLDEDGFFSFGSAYSSSQETLKQIMAKQKAPFKYVRELDPAVPDVDGQAAEEPSNAFIRWDPSEDAGLAELTRSGKPRSVKFVETAIELLATGKQPVVLNSEQREFLALVASHCQEWEEYFAARGTHDLEATPPKQTRILLCGPGGAGKSKL